jgi:phage/plasmid-associated DNA primase
MCIFDEQCLPDQNGQMPASVLYAAFKTWAMDNGFRQVSSTKFGRRLRLIGVPSMHTRSGSVYPVTFRTP